ncbi:tyrosine-type recombinase/integrase [Enterococcus hermanniensis]|uniref:Tyr recombinase domain-containing protein n=1 Tax=Enterococcus hermanniensis TaxID=249189 RepID=A0A1L8TM80_9ENTE|nr:site-specific integrase [Enterococcus hermanniensis]OJG45194.1 hypothetical protein RV04_GL002242 [Enterococcus hermanniensis]
MWIEEVTNPKGKRVYKYNERYFDPKTNRRKKVSVTMPNKARDTKKEAQKLLDSKIDLRLNQKTLKKPTLTFHDLIDEWLPYYQKQVKEATYYATKYTFNTLKNYIPDTWIVSSITASDLVDVLEKILYSNDLSNNYISTMKGKMNKLFTYAVKRQYIDANPIAGVVIERKLDNRSGKIKDKFLEDDEYSRLIDYVAPRNKRYALLFQWLYYTGMRPGEALALNKTDVSKTSDGSFHVNITGTMMDRRRVKDMKKSDSTKSSAGMREIDLPKMAIEVYHELLEISPTGHFLFQTSRGTPLQNSGLNTYLRNHKQKMKIDKPLSLHIFRHTHISKLAELGVPLYVIQDRVGHEHSDITEKIYTHVTKNSKQRLKENLEKL